MDEKIKKLALSFEDLVKDYSTPQLVYDSLMRIAKSQKDYFEVKGPSLIIQLTFLIYSYKQTNNFDLGIKMLNDSMFLFTLFSDGNEHREMCEACFGEGEVECNACDGTGEVPCDTCDETGEIPCDTCDGSGVDPDNEEESCWDCNGAGNRTCPSCNGETIDTCEECGGRRFENCQECDGIGQIETDDWDYEMECILSWDKSLISDAIEFENTLVSLMSFDEYNEQNNYIVITYYGDDNYLEFKKGFRSKEVYCFGHDDNPDIKFTTHSLVATAPFKNLNNFGS